MSLSLRGAIACALAAFASVVFAVTASPGSASPGTCESGDPCWTLSPASGPVGTTVHFSGDLPSGYDKQTDDYQHKDPLFGLSGPYPANAKYQHGCPSFSPNLSHLQFSTDFQTRRIHGSFVIGAIGYCGYQGMPDSEIGPQPTIAGRYRFAWSCIACLYGEFKITYPPRTLALTGADTGLLLVSSAALLTFGAALMTAGRRRPKPTAR